LVRVRFLSDPCVLGWCWELVDPADGHILESSWTHSWTTYDSSEVAYAEGEHRLDVLARSRLVIVAREEPELHDWLLRKLAGDPGVTIVRDRRQGDRRAGPTALIVERRQAERRHRPDVDAELRTRGWALVRALEKAA